MAYMFCDDHEYYDSVVNQCSPCREICNPRRDTESQCRRDCPKDYPFYYGLMSTSGPPLPTPSPSVSVSDRSDVNTGIVIVIFLGVMIALLVVILAVLLFKVVCSSQGAKLERCSALSCIKCRRNTGRSMIMESDQLSSNIGVREGLIYRPPEGSVSSNSKGNSVTTIGTVTEQEAVSISSIPRSQGSVLGSSRTISTQTTYEPLLSVCTMNPASQEIESDSLSQRCGSHIISSSARTTARRSSTVSRGGANERDCNSDIRDKSRTSYLSNTIGTRSTKQTQESIGLSTRDAEQTRLLADSPTRNLTEEKASNEGPGLMVCGLGPASVHGVRYAQCSDEALSVDEMSYNRHIDGTAHPLLAVAPVHGSGRGTQKRHHSAESYLTQPPRLSPVFTSCQAPGVPASSLQEDHPGSLSITPSNHGPGDSLKYSDGKCVRFDDTRCSGGSSVKPDIIETLPSERRKRSEGESSDLFSVGNLERKLGRVVLENMDDIELGLRLNDLVPDSNSKMVDELCKQ